MDRPIPAPENTVDPPRTRQADLVDIEAIAGRLGVNVRHVRRLVAERRIPFVKWGHLLRFELDDIDRWIDEHRRAPVDRHTAPLR